MGAKFGGSKESTFRRRNQDVKSRASQYFCNLCGIKLRSATRFEEHMNAHEGKGFHCSYCGKPFKTKEAIGYHEKEHRGIFRFECPHCPERFNKSSHFKQHAATHLEK